jgi:hypothetical protein
MMINRHDMFMVKVANMTWEQWQKERRKRQNIRKALQKREPRTYKERQVERLAGRQYTGGQMARGGAIGAGVGAAGKILGDVIQSGRKGLAGALKSPRALAAAAMKGTLVGAVVPTLKRKADVRAAETGWY